MQSGILDRSRLAANVLMVVLVGMNIFFSIQYSGEAARNRDLIDEAETKQAERVVTASFLKLFVDKVLATGGTVTFDDRVKIESDIRGVNDQRAVSLWNDFVNSKDSSVAQTTAVKLMSHLLNKLI